MCHKSLPVDYILARVGGIFTPTSGRLCVMLVAIVIVNLIVVVVV